MLLKDKIKVQQNLSEESSTYVEIIKKEKVDIPTLNIKANDGENIIDILKRSKKVLNENITCLKNKLHTVINTIFIMCKNEEDVS